MVGAWAFDVKQPASFRSPQQCSYCWLAAIANYRNTNLPEARWERSYSVRLVGPPEHLAFESVRGEIENTLTRIERIASTYRDDSEINRLSDNPAIDEWLPVSRELCAMINTGANAQ